MAVSPINIPNTLSTMRLLLVPVLLVLANKQAEGWFLSLLAVALLSDAVDGYVARKLNQTSELGAKLDSWADFLTYVAMVVALLWLWPEIFAREIMFVYLGAACYLVPTLTGLLKFNELPSFHTWAAKASAVFMVPAYYIMVMFDESLLFRIVVVFDIWVAIEAVFITVILNRNRNNVPTVFHARDIMRRQRARLNEQRQRIKQKISRKKNSAKRCSTK